MIVSVEWGAIAAALVGLGGMLGRFSAQSRLDTKAQAIIEYKVNSELPRQIKDVADDLNGLSRKVSEQLVQLENRVRGDKGLETLRGALKKGANP